jgi:hypothetical protein
MYINPLTKVGQTSRGYNIYCEPNGCGGHRYVSDSIGSGVVIYDTCLASREEVELCLKLEADRAHQEKTLSATA